MINLQLIIKVFLYLFSHCVYNKQVMMNGLKNLMPRGIFAEGNYAILKKKSEDFKRSINTFVDHLQQINNIYESYYSVFERNIAQLADSFRNEDNNDSKFFKEIISIFRSLNKELRNFIQKESNNKKGILQLSDLFMADYNVLVENFQERCREYSVKELNLVQSCEQYFKMYKQMMANIENYKNSFMDVNIIYNKIEKIKRYNECVATYKNLEEDLAIIKKKVEELNKDKLVLSEKYQILQRQLTNFTSSFATRYIDELKKFAECLFQLEDNKYLIIFNKMEEMDKTVLQNFFISNINLRYSEYINAEVRLSECQYVPCFIFYCEKLRENARPMFKKMVVIYYQQISIKIEKKKVLNRKIIDYMQRYLKSLDKTLMNSYKQTMLNFDKMRKKIGQVFGNRWLSFYKIISSLFENSIENVGRLMKQVQGKVRMIEGNISEQANRFDSFLKECRNVIDKYISKKIFRKYTEGIQAQNLLQDEVSTSQEEINKISEALSKQIGKANEQVIKHEISLKNLYISFFSDISTSISQFQDFCQEISQNYYHEDVYQKNYQLCSDQIALSVKKQMKFFEETPFYLLNDNLKIIFDGQFNKIEGFKKIKKPKELQQMIQSKNNVLQQFALERVKGEFDEVSMANTNKSQSMRALKQSQKQCFIGEGNSKNAQFLSKRIQFYLNEKFVKSNSCALVDKIILAGRLFVTTHRLFFHSKFNRNTIFFGETFIQIPKNDIKKIQKKTSSLFIDNAISITTVNGQLFFISFLSRDKFFNIIDNTLGINNQQIFFEEQQQVSATKEQQLQFEDDMKMETSAERQKIIVKQIKQFDYKTIFSSQFELIGLNPVKFMKIFQLGQQITINRTLFSSFTYYLKDLAEHKEINIQDWSPNPLDYLNNVNIKEITPECFTRKLGAVVPLPNSGIPFMPKTSFTTEDQTLLIVNKDKYVIQLVVKSNGVPYCDSFDLRIKKTIEKVNQNRVKMTVQIFVNFNQNVMVRSTIEAKSIETSIEAFEKNGNEIRSYLKALQKKLAKNNKRESPQDKLIEQAQLIEQLQKQIQTLKDEKKIQCGLIETQKVQLKTFKIVLIVLGLIIVIQFGFLIF